MTEQYANEIKELAELRKRIESTRGADQHSLTTVYIEKLNRLMDAGWHYALGKDNEIDDRLLPERYKSQREAVIDDLEIQLGRHANDYRAAPAGSDEDRKIVAQYHKTFKEWARLLGEIRGLDPDAELPDRDMPKEYLDQWA